MIFYLIYIYTYIFFFEFFCNFNGLEGVSDSAMSAGLLSFFPSLISDELNAGLVKSFTEQEIVDVIWAMEPKKSPGPDGFSIHFYRACWHIIKSDLVIMISAFLKKAKVGGGTQSTFLAIIPKETNP